MNHEKPKLKPPILKIKAKKPKDRDIVTIKAKKSLGLPTEWATQHDDSFKFMIRPETTDVKVIDEVITRNTYQKKNMDFLIKEGQTWLDLGANIGTFAVLALALGADKVVCYEPESENFQLLKENLKLNGFPSNRYKLYQQAVATEAGKQDLYLCKGDYNKYRHSLIKIRGRATTPVTVTTMEAVRNKDPTINAIKMDIEGSEIEILENYHEWNGIDLLVFEYSFDVDSSIPRFMTIIKELEKSFTTVHYLKVNPNEANYKHFPAATMVYCKKY